MARYQDSKLDIWVPIAPRLSSELAGLWVPRVEGEALRKWLATGRLQEEGKRGITIPVPYTVFDAPEEEELQTVIDQNVQAGGRRYYSSRKTNRTNGSDRYL